MREPPVMLLTLEICPEFSPVSGLDRSGQGDFACGQAYIQESFDPEMIQIIEETLKANPNIFTDGTNRRTLRMMKMLEAEKQRQASVP